jgi:hypothetical protein
MEEEEFYGRFRLYKPMVRPSRGYVSDWILTCRDTELIADLSAELDLQGGGHSWRGIVDGILRRRKPRLRLYIAYDCEADLFSAVGSYKRLRDVAELIQSILADRESFATLVRSLAKKGAID